jgi:hypothetical protein
VALATFGLHRRGGSSGVGAATPADAAAPLDAVVGRIRKTVVRRATALMASIGMMPIATAAAAWVGTPLQRQFRRLRGQEALTLQCAGGLATVIADIGAALDRHRVPGIGDQMMALRFARDHRTKSESIHRRKQAVSPLCNHALGPHQSLHRFHCPHGNIGAVVETLLPAESYIPCRCTRMRTVISVSSTGFIAARRSSV